MGTCGKLRYSRAVFDAGGARGDGSPKGEPESTSSKAITNGCDKEIHTHVGYDKHKPQQRLILHVVMFDRRREAMQKIGRGLARLQFSLVSPGVDQEITDLLVVDLQDGNRYGVVHLMTQTDAHRSIAVCDGNRTHG